jgi:hypothetical protein
MFSSEGWQRSCLSTRRTHGRLARNLVTIAPDLSTRFVPRIKQAKIKRAQNRVDSGFR